MTTLNTSTENGPFTDKLFTENLNFILYEGIYYFVSIERDYRLTPEKADSGFWPSIDSEDGGYVNPRDFANALAEAKIRRAAFDAGEWYYVNIAIRAEVNLRIIGYTEDTISFGTVAEWGSIESDDKTELLHTINRFVFPEAVSHTRSIIKNLAMLIC